MFRLIVVLAIVCMTCAAFADDFSNVKQKSNKPGSSVQFVSQPSNPRQGGDTTALATPIPGLPYSDGGTTCNYVDDYDEACTYTGSTSPDVVYHYSPAVNQMAQIDLCLSLYDTKVYVYDGHNNLIGCNDDAYFGDPPECFSYSSYLEVILFAGTNYYIIIDGYGGDCGEYNMDITLGDICDVVCDADAMPEGEPELVDGYDDNYNGGCNSSPEVYQSFHWINDDDGDCGRLCGVTGWHLGPAGEEYRDTDWFMVTASSTSLSIDVESEFETLVYVLDVTDCLNILVVAGPAYPPACTPTNLTAAVTPGVTYAVFVAPTTFTGPVQEFDYTLRICGHYWDVIPTEDASWGEVKTMFR
jgi:hypothetical protein